MSNTNTNTDSQEFADYCGMPVIVLHVQSTEYGNLATIQFEDGREDEVPLSRINFLK